MGIGFFIFERAKKGPRKLKKYQFLVFFSAILIALGGLFWFAQTKKDQSLDLEQLNALGLVQLPFPRTLENLELLTQEGELFDGSQLVGKWTYAFFGYTNCPDICPVTMNFLESTEQRLRETLDSNQFDVFQGMFVTVDVARDGVDEVREFVSRYSDLFLGVTGTDEKIADFAKQVAVGYRRIPSASEIQYLVEHQGNIVVFDPQGDCYGYIKPPFDTVQLTRLFQHLIKHG